MCCAGQIPSHCLRTHPRDTRATRGKSEPGTSTLYRWSWLVVIKWHNMVGMGGGLFGGCEKRRPRHGPSVFAVDIRQNFGTMAPTTHNAAEAKFHPSRRGLLPLCAPLAVALHLILLLHHCWWRGGITWMLKHRPLKQRKPLQRICRRQIQIQVPLPLLLPTPG